MPGRPPHQQFPSCCPEQELSPRLIKQQANRERHARLRRRRAQSRVVQPASSTPTVAVPSEKVTDGTKIEELAKLGLEKTTHVETASHAALTTRSNINLPTDSTQPRQLVGLAHGPSLNVGVSFSVPPSNVSADHSSPHVPDVIVAKAAIRGWKMPITRTPMPLQAKPASFSSRNSVATVDPQVKKVPCASEVGPPEPHRPPEPRRTDGHRTHIKTTATGGAQPRKEMSCMPALAKGSSVGPTINPSLNSALHSALGPLAKPCSGPTVVGDLPRTESVDCKGPVFSGPAGVLLMKDNPPDTSVAHLVADHVSGKSSVNCFKSSADPPSEGAPVTAGDAEDLKTNPSSVPPLLEEATAAGVQWYDVSAPILGTRDFSKFLLLLPLATRDMLIRVLRIGRVDLSTVQFIIEHCGVRDVTALTSLFDKVATVVVEAEEEHTRQEIARYLRGQFPELRHRRITKPGSSVLPTYPTIRTHHNQQSFCYTGYALPESLRAGRRL